MIVSFRAVWDSADDAARGVARVRVLFHLSRPDPVRVRLYLPRDRSDGFVGLEAGQRGCRGRKRLGMGSGRFRFGRPRSQCEQSPLVFLIK